MNVLDVMLQLESIDLIINIIKIFFINLFTYITYKKIINIESSNNKTINSIIIFFLMLQVAIFVGFVKYSLGTMNSIIVMIVLLSTLFRFLLKNKTSYTILNTIFSLAINYIILFFSVIICFIVNILINIKSDYISLILIILFYIIMISLFLNKKRFKKGIGFLKDDMNNEYFSMLVLNLSTTILILFILLINMDLIFKRRLFIVVVIFSIIMFITIKKLLKLYYKQRLLMRDFKEMKLMLDSKKNEISELEKEILTSSKRNHSIIYKQKLLEYKLKELQTNSEISNELHIIDEVKDLGIEISEKKVNVELRKTGIQEIDDMLEYMKSECLKNEIQFELQIKGNIYQIINNFISKDKLEILIADHIKNSIIAIQHSNNEYKNILMRIGKIDKYFCIYIYDTGIEFERETLEKLGKVPSTTHRSEGGTGMGFMNTFDTIKECKASLIIKEIGRESKDNYTKVLIIKFDDKNEFKIISYKGENKK